MIFCNTTPLIALAGIGQLELLPRVVGEIHVAEAVVAECAAGGLIRVPDLRALPWIQVVAVNEATLPGLLLSLDRGERDTLALAKQLGAERVIINGIGHGRAKSTLISQTNGRRHETVRPASGYRVRQGSVATGSHPAWA